MQLIDDFLNNITMYRLVLYYLIGLVGIGVVLSFLGMLSFSGFGLLFSVSIIVFLGWVVNEIFSKTFNVTTNVESVYISALILSLIISPAKSIGDTPFLFWAIVLTISSKFIFAWQKKHFFNPVALGVFLTSLGIERSANWWVGSRIMLLPVLIGGLLVTRKIKRGDLVFSFLLVSLAVVLTLGLINNLSVLDTLQKLILDSPWLFFAFVMLTEPTTTPPTKTLQIIYGGIVGVLFSPRIHFGSLYSTPELALIVGNIFSYVVSPKIKLLLTLKEKVKLSNDVYDFIFNAGQKLNFLPGQYFEWTLAHDNSDSRGNRRYFTIASAPSEENFRLGVKFVTNGSSYKKRLLSLNPGDAIWASQLAGDFTLPKDKSKKVVLIAGGIGVTPFRSMIKNFIDNNEKRDVVILYGAKSISDLVYTDVFKEAKNKLGIHTYYYLSESKQQSLGENIFSGRVTKDAIIKNVPDYADRIFYLSGPNSMVDYFRQSLKELGISPSNIITDYFPGFA